MDLKEIKDIVDKGPRLQTGRIATSRSKTYVLVCSPNCPFLVLKIGRRICIPGNNFLKWYNSLADYNDLEDKKREE